MSVQEVELEIRDRPVRHVEWSLTSASVTVCGFSVALLGWTATELAANTTTSVNIYDASDHVGVAVIPIRLAANESGESWYGPEGIWFKNGVHINLPSGQAQGSIFFRHLR